MALFWQHLVPDFGALYICTTPEKQPGRYKFPKTLKPNTPCFSSSRRFTLLLITYYPFFLFVFFRSRWDTRCRCHCHIVVFPITFAVTVFSFGALLAKWTLLLKVSAVLSLDTSEANCFHLARAKRSALTWLDHSQALSFGKSAAKFFLLTRS